MSVDSIKRFCHVLSNSLENTIKADLQVKSLEIDCKNLPDSCGKRAENFGQLEPFFTTLSGINKTPVLYWFEVISENTTIDVYNSHKQYKDLKKKATPAIKKSYSNTSKVLYVGKVKSNMRGRFYVHLGYYHNPNTQGLQLYHWAKQIGLKVRLNYIPFSQDMALLMQVIESNLARELQPILGRH